MSEAPSTERAPKRTDGRGNHLWKVWRERGAPKVEYPTLADRAARVFFPWSVFDYPGIGAGMTALLSRAHPGTIRKWRKGERRTPPWALVMIADAAEKRAAAFLHIAEQAKKEAAQSGP